MSTIKKEDILAQLDRTQMSLLWGRGSPASSVAAERVATQQEKWGNGESAFALRSSFTLAKRSGQVNEADYARLKGELEREIDRVNNGFETLGPRELAQLRAKYQPLVGALIEMARGSQFAVELPDLPTYMLALDHVKEVLLSNTGLDAMLSEHEAAKLTESLRTAGRHTEAFAVASFFRIAQGRSGAQGMVVADSIKGAFDWAAEQITRKLDRPEDLSPTWRAIGRLGQALEAGVLEPLAPAGQAPYERWKAMSDRERFDESCRTEPAPSRAPDALRAKMRPFVDRKIAELKKDGLVFSGRNERTQLADNAEQLAMPISHSTVLWFEKANRTVLKLEYFFDPTGREIGARVLEPEP